MKKTFFLLLLITLLLVSACTVNTPAPTPSPDPDPDSQVENPPPSQTATFELPSKMKDANVNIAVAYLGFCDYNEDNTGATAVDYFKKSNPNLDFITTLTNKSVIGGACGEGFLVYVSDTGATLAINKVSENGEVSEILYKGTPESPLLVLANAGAFEPDTQVVFTDSEGKVIQFMLTTNLLRRLAVPTDVFDFTDYSGYLKNLYASRLKSNCVLPTSSELENTSWTTTRFEKDGTTSEYHIDFFKDTANISWSLKDGAEQNSFTAAWSLDTQNDIAILHLDLENLDGKRDFPILFSAIDLQMFVFEDFTTNDTNHSYESIFESFDKTVG